MQGVRERIMKDEVQIFGFANCADGKTIHKDSALGEKSGLEVDDR